MTVKELKEIISKYPDEMEVICDRYSDYMKVSPEEISVVRALKITTTKGVNKHDWILDAKDWRLQARPDGTLYYPELKAGERAEVKEYLHFAGN